MKIVGLVLVILGALALAYGGFTYTKETHDADLGPLKLQLKEKDRIEIPIWLGLGTVAAGAVLLFVGGRKRPSP